MSYVPPDQMEELVEGVSYYNPAHGNKTLTIELPMAAYEVVMDYVGGNLEWDCDSLYIRDVVAAATEIEDAVKAAQERAETEEEAKGQADNGEPNA